MAIKSFSPCSDWFFVFTDTQGKIVNYRLAGWAVFDNDEDKIIGMVPVYGGGISSTMPGHCGLVCVPKIEGTYKHQSEIEMSN